MDLSADAIKAIQDETRLAETRTKAVSLIEYPGDDRKRILVQAGTHEVIDVPAPPRNHNVHTLTDLVEYAISRDDKAELVFWHNEECVTLILDDQDRRDTVSFPLEFSSAWDKLKQINDHASFSLGQKDFIRLLKNEFHVSEATLVIFRKIDFKYIQGAQGSVNVGKESMGRQIESQVKTSTDSPLPEELIVSVPIYVNAGESQIYDVKLLLDYDPQALRICIDVEADRLSHCSDEHQADVAERLEAGCDEVPRFFGHA